MAKKAEPQGMDQTAKIKLGVAIGMIVIAGSILAWQFLGDDTPKGAVIEQMTPEQEAKRKVEIQEAKAAEAEAAKRPGTVRAGE